MAKVAALTLLTTKTWAQNTESPANPESSTSIGMLAPVEQLSGIGLVLRRQTTLGETLNGLPGVSSTYFGPNASRPVIRGQDGDRIAIVNNGSVSLDLSALSYDHAGTIDPLVAQRIEVQRGPGVLQYGGNAVGGVVNVIDGRIPREAFDVQGSVTGRLDAVSNTGTRKRVGLVGFDGSILALDGGNDRFVLHVDYFERETDDVEVPKKLECTQDFGPEKEHRICNSANKTSGGAVGGSLFFDHGYLGASVSNYDNHYGTVVEDEVTIKIRSSRVALEGELRDLGPMLKSLKAQYSQTNYQQTEYEDDYVGMRFKTDGEDLRLEARHMPFSTLGGALNGVLGLQFDRSDFSANGDEAYAPESWTRQSAVFVYEELGLGWGKLSAGARVESVKVESLGIDGNPAFFTDSRDFTPASYALGALWNVAPEWKLTSNLSLNERAPKYYELYANGEHLAMNVEEIGDPNLDMERSTSVDVGAQWQRGAHRAQVQVFQYRFSNYISLEGTDLSADPPQYAYTQVRARFTGAEVSGNARLLDGEHKVDLGWRADYVEAENTSMDQPLPRIAPLRAGVTLDWSHAGFNASLGVDRYAKQDRVPDGQTETNGYTLWNIVLHSTEKRADRSVLILFARLDNITNELAYSSSSILTQTAPGRSPLPGLRLKFGASIAYF